MAGHKYDAGKVSGFKNLAGKFFLPQAEILNILGSEKNEDWAEIGCGMGFFTTPLAGLTNKVYGLDINEKTISLFRRKIEAERIMNISLSVSEENTFPLEKSVVNGVLLAFVVHELDSPEAFFKEVNRILKNNGRLYIVEFEKQNYTLGPPVSHRVSKEQVDFWVAGAGLRPGISRNWSKSLLGWQYLKICAWEYLKN